MAKNETGCFTKILAGAALLVAAKMCSRALDSDTHTATPATASVPSSAAPELASAPPRATEKPPTKVSAETLIGAYSENEIAADTKYKGHRLIVTGTVATVSDGLLGPTVVIGRDFNGVMASGLTKEFAGALTKGEQVELTCKGTGSALGSPTIDCED